VSEQELRSAALVRQAVKQIDKALHLFEDRVMAQFAVVRKAISKQNKRLRRVENLMQEDDVKNEDDDEEEEQEGEEGGDTYA
jgi:hypothetical protein